MATESTRMFTRTLTGLVFNFAEYLSNIPRQKSFRGNPFSYIVPAVEGLDINMLYIGFEYACQGSHNKFHINKSMLLKLS